MNPFSCNNGFTPSFQPGMRSEANQCLRDVAVGGVGGVFAGTGTGLTGCTMFGQGANHYCIGGSIVLGGSIGGAYGAKVSRVSKVSLSATQSAWSSSDSCQKAFCPQK
jgi:hypothetical protein